MKLISMTNFILSDKVKSTLEYEQSYKMIRSYANFLKQPLKLEMFVPYDDEGNVLEEPIVSEHLLDRFSQQPIKDENTPEAYRYRKAKEKVLFEGFKFYSSYTDSIYVANKESNLIQFKNNGDIYVLDEFLSNSISDLIFYFQKEKINLTLTENAIKQIGL